MELIRFITGAFPEAHGEALACECLEGYGKLLGGRGSFGVRGWLFEGCRADPDTNLSGTGADINPGHVEARDGAETSL